MCYVPKRVECKINIRISSEVECGSATAVTMTYTKKVVAYNTQATTLR